MGVPLIYITYSPPTIHLPIRIIRSQFYLEALLSAITGSSILNSGRPEIARRRRSVAKLFTLRHHKLARTARMPIDGLKSPGTALRASDSQAFPGKVPLPAIPHCR